jgi:CpeT protein
MKKYSVLLVFLAAFSCINQTSAQSKDFKKLAAWMEGSFSSNLQAVQDSDFFDIRLHIKRIWNENPNGVWFYVEQAVSTAKEKPYRQRIYHLSQANDSTFESEVYTFSKPLRYVGAWKQSKALADLTVDSIETRKGCSVFLKKKDKATFEGSTNDKDCSSDLRGAKYATSKVTIKKDRLVSWDQGFDAEGNQVWGATKGGYIFLREK